MTARSVLDKRLSKRIPRRMHLEPRCSFAAAGPAQGTRSAALAGGRSGATAVIAGGRPIAFTGAGGPKDVIIAAGSGSITPPGDVPAEADIISRARNGAPWDKALIKGACCDQAWPGRTTAAKALVHDHQLLIDAGCR